MDLSRNLGLISAKQQDRILRSSVLVCGCGGMGGVCAEVLVRMGVNKLTLVDHDFFEPSNANRQIHCNVKTFGKNKASVLKAEFLKINPKAKIKIFKEPVSLKNVKKLLEGVDVVVNGMDQMFASICLERQARRLKIPIVDAWITPFASVFTMKPSDPHWEEFLDFPTWNKPEDKITDSDCAQSLRKEISYTFSHFDPYQHVEKALVRQVISGEKKRPSLAPVVWLSGVLMANEVFKLVTGLPDVGPAGVFYDQYKHRLRSGKLASQSTVRRRKR